MHLLSNSLQDSPRIQQIDPTDDFHWLLHVCTHHCTETRSGFIISCTMSTLTLALVAPKSLRRWSICEHFPRHGRKQMGRFAPDEPMPHCPCHGIPVRQAAHSKSVQCRRPASESFQKGVSLIHSTAIPTTCFGQRTYINFIRVFGYVCVNFIDDALYRQRRVEKTFGLAFVPPKIQPPQK